MRRPAERPERDISTPLYSDSTERRAWGGMEWKHKAKKSEGGRHFLFARRGEGPHTELRNYGPTRKGPAEGKRAEEGPKGAQGPPERPYGKRLLTGEGPRSGPLGPTERGGRKRDPAKPGRRNPADAAQPRRRRPPTRSAPKAPRAKGTRTGNHERRRTETSAGGWAAHGSCHGRSETPI